MWEQSGLLFLLEAVGGTESLNGGVFVLFKDYLAGSGNNHTLDESDICDFDGYSNIACAFPSPPTIDGLGLGSAETAAMTWVRTVTGTTQPVVAIGLLSGAPGSSPTLLWYDDSFASVNMTNAGDEFERVVKFGDDTLVVTP